MSKLIAQIHLKTDSYTTLWNMQIFGEPKAQRIYNFVKILLTKNKIFITKEWDFPPTHHCQPPSHKEIPKRNIKKQIYYN